MRTAKYLLTLAALAWLAAPAPAGGIFSRRSAANPADQVQRLIAAASTSRSAYERADAVEDLRHFDAAAYPQIIPVLVNALRGDPSVTVRIEAARTLGRIRPLLPMAGEALSEAAGKDSALLVRLQARTSLMVYHVAGINPGNRVTPPSADPKAPNGKDPVVVNVPGPVQPGGTLEPFRGPVQPGGTLEPFRGAGAAPSASAGNYPRPLPRGPVQFPAQPTPPAEPLFRVDTPAPIIDVPPPPPLDEPPVPPAPLAPPGGLVPVNPAGAPGSILVPSEGPVLAPPG